MVQDVRTHNHGGFRRDQMENTAVETMSMFCASLRLERRCGYSIAEWCTSFDFHHVLECMAHFQAD